MKKNIYRIFIIVIIAINLGMIKTYSAHIILDDSDDHHLTELDLGNKELTGPGVHASLGLEKLKRDYDENIGDTLNTKMLLNTSIKITKADAKKGKYTIQIGNGSETKKVTMDQLKNEYGYEPKIGEDGQEKTPEINEQWDVALIVSIEPKDYTQLQKIIKYMSTPTEVVYDVWIQEVYSGKDIKDATIRGTSRAIEEENKSISDHIQNTVNQVSDAVDTLKNLKKFAEDFAEEPWGTLANAGEDAIRGFADMIQKIVNMLCMQDDGSKGGIVFTKSEIEADDELNSYAKLGSAESTAQKEISIPINNEAKEYTDFQDNTYHEFYPVKEDGTGGTKIPIIPVDLYTMAIGNVDILDINFLTGDQTHDENSTWMRLRNPLVVIIRIIIMIGMGILITTLLINSISLITRSLTPETRKNHVEGIQRFAVSLVMLIGTVVIMGLGIFASQMILPKTINAENKNELPIRVEVEEAEYSFSTNITGYVRYIAETENIRLWWKKGVYVVVYLVLVLVNAVAALLMFFRMLFMMILAIIGPIIAVLYVLKIEERIHIKYKDWIKLYATLSAIQVVFAIVCRILLEVAINK